MVDRYSRVLTVAAILYGAAFIVHTGDHLRRGLGTVSIGVVVLGTVAGAFQVVAIGAVLTRHRLAPLIAVAVGFPDALGIAAVHLLPNWGVLSDSFPDAHNTGVTALSWIAATAEILTAFLFGAAGAFEIHRRGGLAMVAVQP
jgi:hypothetical protein